MEKRLEDIKNGFKIENITLFYDSALLLRNTQYDEQYKVGIESFKSKITSDLQTYDLSCSF